ncbi:MAG: hypothetical protein PHN42_01685 [Bacilli bacterium]|nr:hypothetical protein [Bacilli bacterium]
MKKIRRKKYKKSYWIISLLLIIITTSVGYSIFSESLSINGTAVAKYVVSGNALNLNLTASGTGGATYTSGTFPTTFASLTSEVLEDNYLTLTFTRTRRYTSYVNCTFVINFKNPYPYTLTSGTRTNTTVTGGSNVSNLASTLSATSIAAYSTGKLTVTARLRTSLTTVIKMQVRLKYVANGVTQYFYYIIIVN